ncbi:MAG: hypothetical protein DHS20C18_30350 [Saprospiraceae bacterium]|nr:MAG: hypothetical protein DHS20C18_30350 [Saprospiraceae bacterium]
MKSQLILYLIIAISLCACNQSSEEATQATDANSRTPTLAADSLRVLYKQYYGLRTAWLPTQRRPEAGKLNPVDEAPLDTMFFVFREQLLEAVRQKDVFHLLEITDEHIKCSFGAENGIPAFVQMWQLDSPENTQKSEVWTTLENILMLGGTFSKNKTTFSAPYVFSTFPDAYDAFEYGAVTGRGVRVRDKPSLQSNVIKTVSYDIVKIIKQASIPETIGDQTYPWLEIEMLDGKKGFIFGQFVNNPTSWRALFSINDAGQWRMVSLLAGD